MKILGGIAKGRILVTPDKGVATRPALARIRNSLFNILGQRLIDKRVLDVFAGTGSLGLEALSRGAKFCLLVENNRACLEIINQNIKILGFTKHSLTVLSDGFRIIPYLTTHQLVFDIIFVAPPYRFFTDPSSKKKLITILDEFVLNGLLETDGLIIIEHRRGQMQPDEFSRLQQLDHRSYGQTELRFFQRKP